MQTADGEVMRKILFWAMTPMMGEHSAHEVLVRNYIGSNSGNLLFLTSMARALMTDDDMWIDSQFTSVNSLTDAEIERINAEYDYFVMPLANAFRSNYEDKLRAMTGFMQKLKIPCVVTGVGIQAPAGQRMEDGFAFDSEAKAFVREVLEHSAMLGVRGARTAEYLKHLGFAEERDFTVTGCPSMYMLGGRLPQTRRCELSTQSRVSVNGKVGSSNEIHAWMAKNCRELPDYRYIAQTVEEFWMMGYGVPLLRLSRRVIPDYIPTNRKNPLLYNGRSLGFLSAYTWLDFMRGMDFSYGCNIHGNIIALLAGTPAMVVESDLRVSELAEFYEIPRITLEDIRADRDIMDLYARADYGPLQRNHAARFAHFVDFLNKNGLRNIYADGENPEEAPYDRYVRSIGALPAYYPAKTAELFNPGRMLPMGRKVFNYYRNRVKSKIRRTIQGK